MWTLQEAVVGRIGELMYGDKELPLSDALKILLYLGKHHGVSLPYKVIEELLKMYNIKAYWHKRRYLPLWRLLFEFASRKCTDPRDRIYALQGLMKDSVNVLLQSDYTKSVEEVYSNATRHFIAQRASLDIICGHQYEKGLLGLPSWVPDYQFHGKEPSSLIRVDQVESIYNSSLSNYLITEQQDTTILLDDWYLLRTTGFSLGTITASSDNVDVTDTLQFGWQKWQAMLAVTDQTSVDQSPTIKHMSTLMKVLGELSGVEGFSATPFHLTSVLDLEQELRNAIEDIRNEDKDSIRSSIDYLLTIICGRWGPTERCRDLDEKLARAYASDTDGEELIKLVSNLTFGVTRRRVAVLSSGELAAIPQQAENGDQICILIGCSVPVVLRHKDGDEFGFVGECYVHDAMDGEAMEKKEKGTYEEIHIVLK